MNAIRPGIVPTPGYHTSLGMTQDQVDEYVQSSIGSIPLGRPGTTDEIAKAVSFLASDDSSYVNGIELFMDAGWLRSDCLRVTNRLRRLCERSKSDLIGMPQNASKSGGPTSAPRKFTRAIQR